MKNLVILGCGYGGMKILSSIIPNLPYNLLVTIIDKSPDHCLKTEYYALAAGTVSDEHIRIPFPTHPQVLLVNEEVLSLDLDKNLILLKNKDSIHYDDLIIGLGCEDNYHHIKGADTYTQSIQTIEKAIQTYNCIRELPLHSRVAIIGAGLSGVELAAELNESRPDLSVSLFDRGKTILSSYSIRVSNYVTKWFESRGVQIIHSSNITAIEKNTVYNHGEANNFDCIVWTAGVKPNKVVQDLQVAKDKKGRILLTKHHHLANNEHIFVVGDCASLSEPSSAQLAEGQAEQIALILNARWKGEKPPEKLPAIKVKGVLGSLGKKHGFGLVANKPLTGRVPRLIKLGVLWKDKTKKRQFFK
ncbi:MAG: NAD(P)/FAD-dependent oxidoreductase [Bacillus sp. (in: firmicutes)]